MGTFIADMQKNGSFIDGAGLQRTAASHRVRLEKGKITVTDGPFVETRRSSAATRSLMVSRARRRSTSRGGSWSCIVTTGQHSGVSRSGGRSRTRPSRRRNSFSREPRELACAFATDHQCSARGNPDRCHGEKAAETAVA